MEKKDMATKNPVSRLQESGECCTACIIDNPRLIIMQQNHFHFSTKFLVKQGNIPCH